MNHYISVVKKFFVFNGRAGRSEYWYFVLFHVLISIGFTLVGAVFSKLSFLTGIYAIVVILPSLGVMVRRLHDSGRSGWWALISIIPIVGTLVLLYFLIKKSDEGENEYGSHPVEVG